jgi:ParB-like chromosome segregation protein Spo0J
MPRTAKTANAKPALPTYKVDTWPIRRLKRYERNARTHSDKQVEQLRGSFRKFGQVWPILVREDGTIIAGHGRLEAAKAEKLKTVQVIVAHDWTEEQCRAFGLLDNKVALNSGWDEELLTAELVGLKKLGSDLSPLGFSEKELDRLLPIGEGGSDPDLKLQAAFQILIECKSEVEQVELLTKFQKDGIVCRALIV